MERLELFYEKTNGLAPFSYTVAGQWLYFCDQHVPGLFRYHFENRVCECVAKINKNYIKSHFYKFYTNRNILWMLPFLKEKIVSFDLITQEMAYYDIPPKIEEEIIPFIDMFFWKEKAYLAPRGNNRFLIQLDLLTHEMQEIELQETEKSKDEYFFNGAVQFQQRIYMIESSKGQIVLFDVDDNKKEILSLGGHKAEGVLARSVGEKIYFFPIMIHGDESVLIYDINTGCFVEKEYPIKNLPEGDVCIHVVFGSEIWVLANKQKKIYKINDNLDIKSEISIRNFNEKMEEVYVSGMEFSERFFWNGHKGNPLIQVKDGNVEILDVSKNRTLLEIYIEMINESDGNKEKFDEFHIGKTIYNKTII